MQLNAGEGSRETSSLARLKGTTIKGQYHKTVNLDKKEYIHPHRIDNGLKLMEQVGFEKSAASALFLLLASSNGRGGGDAPDHPMIGRWAGDRVAVLGDYSEPDDIPGIDAKAIYASLEQDFTDISADVTDMLNTVFDE